MRQAQWCTPVIPPGDQETKVILGYTRPCLIEEFHMEDEDGGTMYPSVHGQAASATQTAEGWRREPGDTFLPFSITTGVMEREDTEGTRQPHTQDEEILYSVHSLQLIQSCHIATFK